MLKKVLVMLSMISILTGPMVYLSIANSIGSSGPSFSLSMPDLGFSDMVKSAGDSLPDMKMPAMAESETASGTTVYKWRDAAGVWQYSNELPAGVGQVETVTVTPNTSVQAFKAPTPEPAPQPPENNQAAPESLDLLPTPGRVKKLIEDAKNVQNLVDERSNQIDRAVAAH